MDRAVCGVILTTICMYKDLLALIGDGMVKSGFDDLKPPRSVMVSASRMSERF